ncbi:MAG: DUF2442 domain-containing protein [Cytophagaceae bacterium]|nr:DUF2442 domain-containing protein [Cytophagaceae bacterium]
MRVHQVESVDFQGNNLLVRVDEQTLNLPLEAVSSRLFHAEPGQRQLFEVSPSGYGIHWPVLDEDLSVDGLIRLHHELHTLTQ